MENVMKNLLIVLPAVLALLLLTNTAALAQTGGEKSGKGAMFQRGPIDDDGDGIPNGLDPDYVKPQDGSGHQFGKKSQNTQNNQELNGNGTRTRARTMNITGAKAGSGVCDGTGPKGNAVRKGK